MCKDNIQEVQDLICAGLLKQFGDIKGKVDFKVEKATYSPRYLGKRREYEMTVVVDKSILNWPKLKAVIKPIQQQQTTIAIKVA